MRSTGAVAISINSGRHTSKANACGRPQCLRGNYNQHESYYEIYRGSYMQLALILPDIHQRLMLVSQWETNARGVAIFDVNPNTRSTGTATISINPAARHTSKTNASRRGQEDIIPRQVPSRKNTIVTTVVRAKTTHEEVSSGHLSLRKLRHA